MNTIVTSREAILAGALRLAAAQGLDALSMRAVDAECGVAVGSVYNYFPSKAALQAAVVGEVWQSIFHEAGACEATDDFCEAVRRLYGAAQRGSAQWPHFFTLHTAGFGEAEKAEGRARMEHAFAHMKAGLAADLHADPRVRPDAFGPGFSEADCIDFIFNNLLMLLSRGERSCEVLLELVRRALY